MKLRKISCLHCKYPHIVFAWFLELCANYLCSDEGAGGDEDYFAASRLYEYRWPPEQERAELYFLQEQVAEFLRIRGIQRKYPGQLQPYWRPIEPT